MNPEKTRVANISVVAAIALTTMKLVVGLATGSLGIISEAAHSGLDAIAAIVTAVAVRVSGKPADEEHQYGHGKVENFSALFETILLLGTCVWISYEAINRMIYHEYKVEVTVWSFLVIAASIAIDVNRSAMLYRAARKYNSQALEADALHFSSDIFSSAVVLVGLVFVRLGVPIGDPIAALGVAVMVVVASCRLGKKTIEALLDSVPTNWGKDIKVKIERVPGVIKCQRLRARYSGADLFIDARVEVDERLTMTQVSSLLETVEAEIKTVVSNVDVMISPVLRSINNIERPLNEA